MITVTKTLWHITTPTTNTTSTTTKYNCYDQKQQWWSFSKATAGH